MSIDKDGLDCISRSPPKNCPHYECTLNRNHNSILQKHCHNHIIPITTLTNIV